MLASHEPLALEVRVVVLRERCTLKDGQNSVRKVVDASGSVVASYDYDAFGNVLAQTQPSGWIFAHRAFGEVQDPNLGFTYLRARWMDPGTGRFESRDRFQGNNFDPSSLHRYTYANLDPVNKLDPSGDLTFSEVLVTVAIVGILATEAIADLGPLLAKYSGSRWGQCFVDCVDQRSVNFWPLFLFSAIPKGLLGLKVLRDPYDPLTSASSGLSHLLWLANKKKKSYIQRSIRQFGRKASKIATPLLVIEGLFDWYVIGGCSYHCAAQSNSKPGTERVETDCYVPPEVGPGGSITEDSLFEGDP